MKWNAERRAVAEAVERLDRVRRHHRAQTQWLRDGLHAHRGLFAVVGGLAGGFVLGRLPLSAWLRAGISAAGAAVSIARTPLGPVAFAALLGRKGGVPATRPHAGDRGG